MLVEIGIGDSRLEAFLGLSLGGVANHPFFVGQLLVEVEGIGPIERQDGRFSHGTFLRI